ncbi:MAG: hypothetical protein RKO24_13735 [Candidatus Competibacter sp.]|nr:hypothetical protein [Candidatus Competibacter sp.]
MNDEITLIGGSHHLTTTRQRDHLIARPIPEPISELSIDPLPANASKPIAVEYYDLRGYLVFGNRYWFYIFRGLDKAEAVRLIENAIQNLE